MRVRRSVLACFLAALLSLVLVVAPLAGAAPPAADDGRGPETGARAGDHPRRGILRYAEKV
ncbi:MAG: hypothetical protein AB1816_09675 [Bacillota bacterium]